MERDSQHSTVQIPGIGARTFTHSQLWELYASCVTALEQALPDEGTQWLEDPARARTSGRKPKKAEG